MDLDVTPPLDDSGLQQSDPLSFHHPRAPADALDYSPDRRPKKSSSTCTTCRARKVRCNGARDVCSNCQRLGFPCSYDDADPGAWSVALPRRRVRQACLSCHSRKARCSGHMPACERCRAQGIECIYRPSKRTRIGTSVGERSPQSHDSDRDDGQNDSDPGLSDPASTATPSTFNHDGVAPDESLDALIGRTFDKFFRHVHHIPMYGFLHRASLMEQYHAGKVDKALLFALIGITSRLTDMGPGMRDYGERCINDAEALIFADYTRPSTIKVQALVLIIKYRVLSNKFPNAFVLLGIASRFAAALRLNYESPSLCFLAQESRRRLMWSLYCIDLGLSGGHRDFSIWSTDRIYVGLPCNERNFEFDLPQETEKLIPNYNAPKQPQAEDIGSLALHIRILHIRNKIAQFSKGVLMSRTVNTGDLQTRVLELHKELDDFANHLPASFQFSDNSLRLRAYSPRICVFVMIHIWWRQCHCDLYRVALVDLREALPRSALANFDNSFLEHCQRQCLEHSREMASIFSAMQKLNARPVADLDLAICAYQCARMMIYSYHTNAEKFRLTAETVKETTNVCLQAIKQCCAGPAAAGIKTDLEKLIAQGLGMRSNPSRSGSKTNGNGNHHRNLPRNSLLRSLDANDEAGLASNPYPSTPANAAPMTHHPFPPSIMADPWANEDQLTPDVEEMHDVQVTRGKENIPIPPRPEFAPTELNNAYEGALDGLGMDNGLDYAMGLDLNMWLPSGDWMGQDFSNSGVGV